MGNNLPKNWVETEVGVISEIIRGITYNKLQAKPFKENDNYLVLRGGNIQDGKITTETKDVVYVESSLVKKQQQILKGDVVIVGSTGSKRLIGKAGIAKKDYKEISFGAFLMLIRPSELIEKSLFDYYFISDNYRNVIRDLAGGVNINNIRREYITGLKFPLPPLKEQQRIVAKLDEIFTHLETLKTRLNNIPTLLKHFRQAILTQAVTGKLTQEQRGSKSIQVGSPITIGDEFQEKPKGWAWYNLIDLAKLESGHTPRKSKEEYWINGDVPWISLQDIRAAHGTIITDTKYKPNMVGINNSSARLLPKGTVCFSRDISVGYTTIMGKEMATTQHFANWVCSDKLFNKYLLYAFLSAKDFLIASGKGTTVKTIYMPALKQFRLLVPPKQEQVEIVKIIENLFAKADKIEAQYVQLKKKIDSLPQAILAKAFKGELVPQLPTDGDAKDLLAEIQKLKEASLQAKKKSVKRKTKVKS